MPTRRRRGKADEAMFAAGRALGQASSMLNHAVAERFSLHPTSWECLSLLLAHGSMPAGRLAELTGLTTGAVTGLVDRLEAGGYVRRQKDPADRRRVIVELIPAALADAFPLFEPMLADMGKLHANYNDEQLKAMVECLTGAAEVLRRHALRIRAETASERRAGRAAPDGT